MKFAFIISSLLLSSMAVSHGAVINLLPQGDYPSLADHHRDVYFIPWNILGTSPLMELTVTLEGTWTPLMAANFNPGGMPTPLRDPSILGDQIDNDTHLLIAPSPNIVVSDVIETSDKFSVRLTFIQGITAFNGSREALRGVHSNQHGLTTVRWTMKYQDGSERTFVDGIIPEPSAALLSLVGLTGGLLRRRRTS